MQADTLGEVIDLMVSKIMEQFEQRKKNSRQDCILQEV